MQEQAIKRLPINSSTALIDERNAKILWHFITSIKILKLSLVLLSIYESSFRL